MPTGLTLAVPLGFLRGHVMVFMPSGQNLAEFLITGGGWFVLVSTRPVQKLHMSIDGIEAAFREVIAGLRLVPAGGQVSCELWLYSRYGTFRHFRVSATGLVEINAYGTPLDQLNTSPAVDPSGGTETTEPAGLSAALPTRPGIDPRSPIIRWLVKWNAARLAGEKGGGVENEGLKKALAAGGPAVKKKRPAGKKPEKNPAGKKPEAKPAGEKPEKTPAGPEKNSGTGTDGVPAKKPGTRKSGRQKTKVTTENGQDTGISPEPGSGIPSSSYTEVAGQDPPVTGQNPGTPTEGDDQG